MKKFSGFICLLFMLQSCGTLDVYEKTVFFSDHQWKGSNKCSFNFDITDTTSLYNIYIVLRHEDAYHFNNIWLRVTTQAPRDSALVQMIDVPLADNKKGWLGTGMDDVIDHRARITRSPVRLRKGNYLFTLQQNMREEPLQFVLNAGIRVEKVKQ